MLFKIATCTDRPQSFMSFDKTDCLTSSYLSEETLKSLIIFEGTQAEHMQCGQCQLGKIFNMPPVKPR